MISVSISSTFVFGALTISETVNQLVAGISIISFLFVLGGEVTQSIADLEGDKSKGVKSIAIINESKVAKRAKGLGIHRVPAVVIDGHLADCCKGPGPDEATLRAAGLGSPA